MSRSGTATPPAAFFPQKVATPSVRHSAPTSSSQFKQYGGTYGKKSKKHAAGTSHKVKSSGLPDQPMEMSFEDISVTPVPISGSEMYKTHNNQSSASFMTFQSAMSVPGMDQDVTTGSYLSVPNGTRGFYSASSANNTPLVTPNQSETCFSPLSIVGEAEELIASSCSESRHTPIPSGRSSWTSNIGKMAKAVVHTGKSMGMGMSFGERKKKDAMTSDSVAVSSPAVEAQAVEDRSESIKTDSPPQGPLILETEDLLQHTSIQCDAEPAPPALSTDPRQEMVGQYHRIVEYARLCSQWPDSGYQKSKFGPNGSKTYYSPASFSNPEWTANIMQRQANLEAEISRKSASYFKCRRAYEESDSDDGTEQSIDSYMSSRSSPSSSIRLEAEMKTIADVKAAMDEPMICSVPLVELVPVQGACSGRKSIKVTRSISELDALASSMKLSSPGDDVMQDTTSFKHERGASAGSKRSLQPIGPEEEKRRKVDEAMVVEEAVSSGVIMPSAPPKIDTNGHNRQLSSSAPDLSDIKKTSGPAMFGHVVKTSDTHPIIISTFFPNEMLPIIAQSLVQPTHEAETKMMSSKIDVAALLLAHTPNSSANSSAVSSPIISNFRQDFERKTIGNLFLSSCPGKRLRMEGPVKGRPPVCRDLETDLRRIKSEGVGCLVCCLDDTELALLGVPWETYHSIATKIGLDVIRMPMPDGFTPVNMSLFDSHVGLICQNYTLQGINVLVHCRGGVGRAGLTASAWAIKMGFVQPHQSLQNIAESSKSTSKPLSAELEHQIVMSMVERVIAMIRSRRGLKAIESFEQVKFLATYVGWVREKSRPIVRGAS